MIESITIKVIYFLRNGLTIDILSRRWRNTHCFLTDKFIPYKDILNLYGMDIIIFRLNNLQN